MSNHKDNNSDDYLLLMNNDDDKNLKVKNNEGKKTKKYILLGIIIFCLIIFGGKILLNLFTPDEVLIYNKNSDGNETNVKISVIIPIYNTEEYIDRCMQSVLNQTLKEIEVICINDASTDNSLNILRKYVDSDPRVKVINFRKSKGKSYGRNAGMEIAKGEFYGYIDSDSTIDLKFYENLYNHSKDNDIVVGKLCEYTNFLDESYAVPLPLIHGYVGDSIYRKEFITKNNILFPISNNNNNIQEDKLFRIDCFKYNPKMITTDNYCYYFQKNEGSTRNISKSFINKMNKKIKDNE